MKVPVEIDLTRKLVKTGISLLRDYGEVNPDVPHQRSYVIRTGGGCKEYLFVESDIEKKKGRFPWSGKRIVSNGDMGRGLYFHMMRVADYTEGGPVERLPFSHPRNGEPMSVIEFDLPRDPKFVSEDTIRSMIRRNSTSYPGLRREKFRGKENLEIFLRDLGVI